MPEVIDQWNINERPDGSHYASWCENTRYETFADIENGTVNIQRKNSTKDMAVPLKVILRLAELVEKG